jgi:hypothetical protein
MDRLIEINDLIAKKTPELNQLIEERSYLEVVKSDLGLQHLKEKAKFFLSRTPAELKEIGTLDRQDALRRTDMMETYEKMQENDSKLIVCNAKITSITNDLRQFRDEKDIIFKLRV